MLVSSPVLQVRFYRTREGREPVREWLIGLPAGERIKKSQETPLHELRLARRRKRELT